MSIFDEALKYIPGGVNSPVRAFKSVGGEPVFIRKGYGSKVVDEDGREYIDYVCSYGPLILGHADKDVVNAICDTAKYGTTFGAPNVKEVELAKLICRSLSSIEMVRFVNSGTEAVMSAVRLARAYTERDKIIKFDGCYHGHSDFLLARAGSGVMSLSLPASAGVPECATSDTLLAEYNSADSVSKLFEKYSGQIAAVIVEPVAANMGVVLPEKDFLKDLRRICDENRALLIFDEVITGFRLGLRGAQGLFNVKPDLTILGKIIGGGLPVGAVGGKKTIMELFAPIGPVYQAGTLSGNPVAMAAGIATLEKLFVDGFYDELNKSSAMLFEGLKDNFRSIGIDYKVNYLGSTGTIFFTTEEVKNYKDVEKVDRQMYASFFHFMLEKDIYLAPSPFEAMFVSAAHSEKDIEKTLNYHMEFLKSL
jgi:glutamate-1-semialdehyde 2,1-aminomutase